MGASSRWLEALQQRWLEEQSARDTSPYDPSLGAALPQPSANDALASSGLMPEAPQGSPDFGSRVATGAARGGIGGGLAALFADPNAPRSDGGANTWDMFSGVAKGIGRALGSAYGNPGFAIAAREADSRDATRNAVLEQNRRETERELAEKAEKRARAAAVTRAMQGIDPTTKEGNAEAVARLIQMGEHDVAKNVSGLYRAEPEAKAPQSRTRHEGGDEVFEEFDPATGGYVERSRAPRWNPREGRGGGGSARDDAPTVSIQTGPDGMPLNAWDAAPLDLGNKQAVIGARTMARQLEQDSGEFVKLQSSQRQLDELESANSPAAEIATLYQFIKQLDPSSVVREGEVALSREGMSYFDRAGLAYKKVGEGGVVTPRMKDDLIATARKMYRAQIPAQIEREKRQFNTGAIQGVPPAALGGSRLTQSDWEKAYGASSAAAPETRNVNGATYVRVPGGWKKQP